MGNEKGEKRYCVVDTDKDKIVMIDTKEVCIAYADRHNKKVMATGGEAYLEVKSF